MKRFNTNYPVYAGGNVPVRTERFKLERKARRPLFATYRNRFTDVIVDMMDASEFPMWWPRPEQAQALKSGVGVNHSSVGEPIFVAPFPDAGERDGDLLAVVQRLRERRSELIILDTADIAAEPVATIHAPYRLKNAIHNAWLDRVPAKLRG